MGLTGAFVLDQAAKSLASLSGRLWIRRRCCSGWRRYHDWEGQPPIQQAAPGQATSPPLLHPDYLADVMVRYLEYVKDVMTASFYHISLSTETISHVEHEKKCCPVLKDRATDMQVT
jgi:hypothetical protein